MSSVADSIAKKIEHLENRNMKISHVSVSWDAWYELMQEYNCPVPNMDTPEDIWMYRGYILKRNLSMTGKTVMVIGQPRG